MELSRNEPWRIVIVGASGSIGSALARRLAARGVPLVLAGRDAKAIGQLAGELDAVPATVDATRTEEMDRLFEMAQDRLGGVEGAVSCVGSLLLKPAHRTSESEWSQVIAANLTSAFALVRAAAGRMQRQGGSIALVSSAAGRVGIANHEAIAAAKGGVIGLTLSAAATYASRGIRVNCVAPGLVESNLTRQIVENESARSASLSMHALGRLGRADDVAAALAWVLDPEQSWVTGQVLGVDGGLGSVLSRR